MFQETLKELFLSWKAVRGRYREVVLFVAGLMKDPRPLVQHLYEMQVEYYLDEMRAGYDLYGTLDPNLFWSFHTESTVPLPHPLHNQYINHYDHNEDDTDTTPVYWPSRLYLFSDMRHEVVLGKHKDNTGQVPECAMRVITPKGMLTKTLLSKCRMISEHQPVNNLELAHIDYDDATDAEVPMLSRNIQSLIIESCLLSSSFKRNILRQLHNCVALRNLHLIEINLSELKEDLDQLLDNLVSNHEKGLSQGKLKIWIYDEELSEEFVSRWNERCEGITSIDCIIRHEE